MKWHRKLISGLSFIVFAVFLLVSLPPAVANPLEIHIINVQQGSSLFVRGPNGTTMLIDGGDFGRGNSFVVPYLQKMGITPSSDALDYMVVSHRHKDHFGGLVEVVKGGYGAKKIYDNASPNAATVYQNFMKLVKDRTRAGRIGGIPFGKKIDLGNGATATCVAVRGKVYRGPRIITNLAKADENDLSVGLLIKYNQFEFLTAGDMGGGMADKDCTGRKTQQKNIETSLAQTLVGRKMVSETQGIEVLHVNHHGAESSTNADYMNLLTPAVAVISVGDGQSADWFHPRKIVVEEILMAKARSCVTAPKVELILQTEEGKPTGPKTSFEGHCVGDIVITTDGVDTYVVSASGNVSQGPDERRVARLPKAFKFDERR